MIIFKDAYICDAKQYKKANLKIDIENKKIIDIQDNIQATNDDKVISLGDKVIMPHFIDLNTRLKNNKLSSKNISLLSQKAQRGGVYEFLVSPNINNEISDDIALEFISNKIPNLYLSIRAIKNNKLNEISILHKKGAKGICVDICNDEHLFLKAFEYAKMFNMTIFFFSLAQDKQTVDMINSNTSSILGLNGLSTIQEYANVAKVIEYAKSLNISVLFQSLINPKSLHLIKQANQKNIQSEVSIHHLILDDTKCLNYNSLAKIYPPLATKEMKQELINALKNDEISCLTSLESEVSSNKKNISFKQSDFGISCIEEYFSLVYTYLVKTNIISLSKASELMSYNPSLITKNKHFLIQKGNYSNLLVIDLKYQQTLDKVKSPYCNETLFGKIENLMDTYK
jgi:dihydroorotase